MEATITVEQPTYFVKTDDWTVMVSFKNNDEANAFYHEMLNRYFGNLTE